MQPITELLFSDLEPFPACIIISSELRHVTFMPGSFISVVSPCCRRRPLNFYFLVPDFLNSGRSHPCPGDLISGLRSRSLLNKKCGMLQKGWRHSIRSAFLRTRRSNNSTQTDNLTWKTVPPPLSCSRRWANKSSVRRIQEKKEREDCMWETYTSEIRSQIISLMFSLCPNLPQVHQWYCLMCKKKMY